MDKKKLNTIINNRAKTDENDTNALERIWHDEIAVLSEDISGTMDYLINECTAEEYSWISEIIDNLIETTKSRELLECYKKLSEKYPTEYAEYNISFCITEAEAFL